MTIDIWNNTTLNKFYISENAHIPKATLLYVKPMWCSGVPEIYGQLEEGNILSQCALHLKI